VLVRKLRTDALEESGIPEGSTCLQISTQLSDSASFSIEEAISGPH
jgi:hypothetical protein